MSYPEKHIALVCNPIPEKEKARRVTESIALLLSGMDIHHSIFVQSWPQHFEDITEVWIIGGDGTVNYFINHYPHINLPLSVFAGGSGNDFHWMLYGNKTVEQQVEEVLEGKPLPVDAGRVNDRLFLNGVGIGFDGAIVKDLLDKKKFAGKTSYFLSILRHIVGYQEKRCTLQIGKESITENCFMISIANAQRYGGGFKVAPRASVHDSLLDISVIGRISPLKRLFYLRVVEKGKHLNLSFVHYRQTEKILIHSAVSLHAHVDGEYFYEKEFRIEVLPKRFSFLC